MKNQLVFTKENLDKFKIPVQVHKISGNPFEEMFKAVAEIADIEKNKELILNVATGGSELKCASISAAFVNGIKAFSVAENEAMLLPVLKFSYYKMLTDKKMNILKLLTEPECCSSLNELSQKTKMSLPLISYHINGTPKSPGLKELGLVDVEDNKGMVDVRLSSLGRLLIKGYITS